MAGRLHDHITVFRIKKTWTYYVAFFFALQYAKFYAWRNPVIRSRKDAIDRLWFIHRLAVFVAKRIEKKRIVETTQWDAH